MPQRQSSSVPTGVRRPLVSVIIPAHGAAATIAETLASALGQTYRNLEILAVDDGSRDSTAEIVQAIASRDRRVRLLRQANHGVASARNLGLAHASGEYIAPLDADDLWKPTKVELQVRCMEEGGPGVGLVYSWWDIIDSEGRPLATSHPWRIEGEAFEALLSMNFVGNASVPLFRRSALEEVGGYDPQFRAADAQGCEDWDLALRVAERYEVRAVPDRLVAYRRAPDAMSSNSGTMIRSHALMLEKIGSRRAIPLSWARRSRAQIVGYVIMNEVRAHRYREAATRLWKAFISSEVSFRSRWVLEWMLGGWFTGWRSGTGSENRMRREPDGGIEVAPTPATGAPLLASEIAGSPAVADGRSVRAASVMVVSNGVQLAIAAGAVAVLARLLVPADFGIFAMVAVVLGLVANLRDFGIPAATIQSRDLGDGEVSRLFWLSLKLSVLLAVCTIAAAPLLARFFREPALVGITVAMAFGSLLAAAGALHMGLLAREMRFSAVAATETSAALFGAVVGIAAALRGLGYWSLVLQHVAMMLVLGGLPWLLCRWRPGRSQDSARARIGSLLSYGTNLSLARVVTYAGQNMGFLVVGRALGAGALGLYQSAARWATLPVLQVFRPLDQVVVSALRPLRGEPDRYRAAMSGTIRATAAFVLPIVALLGVVAHDAVSFLLGPKWIEAVPLFRVLAAAAFLDVVRLSGKWLHLSEGRTDRQLRWALLSTPWIVAGTAAGAAWGALGVSLGFTLAVLLLTYPAGAYALATSQLTARDFWGALAIPAGSALLAALITWNALPALAAAPLVFRLGSAATLYVFAYLGSWMIMPGGPRALREVVERARLIRGSGSASSWTVGPGVSPGTSPP
jgi:O-antigen/teichoic acid export membrane protein/glycosyltransferase involved in cell wall biosynthesis